MSRAEDASRARAGQDNSRDKGSLRGQGSGVRGQGSGLRVHESRDTHAITLPPYVA